MGAMLLRESDRAHGALLQSAGAVVGAHLGAAGFRG
jgi:hypothetical protein